MRRRTNPRGVGTMVEKVRLSLASVKDRFPISNPTCTARDSDNGLATCAADAFHGRGITFPIKFFLKDGVP